MTFLDKDWKEVDFTTYFKNNYPLDRDLRSIQKNELESNYNKIGIHSSNDGTFGLGLKENEFYQVRLLPFHSTGYKNDYATITEYIHYLMMINFRPEFNLILSCGEKETIDEDSIQVIPEIYKEIYINLASGENYHNIGYYLEYELKGHPFNSIKTTLQERISKIKVGSYNINDECESWDNVPSLFELEIYKKLKKIIFNKH